MSAGLLLVSHSAVESVKCKLSFHILQDSKSPGKIQPHIILKMNLLILIPLESSTTSPVFF